MARIYANLLLILAQALLRMIKEWPTDIYDLSAIIFAVQAELSRSASSSSGIMTSESVILMECLAELCVLHSDSHEDIISRRVVIPLTDNLEKHCHSSYAYGAPMFSILSAITIFSQTFRIKYCYLWNLIVNFQTERRWNMEACLMASTVTRSSSWSTTCTLSQCVFSIVETFERCRERKFIRLRE